MTAKKEPEVISLGIFLWQDACVVGSSDMLKDVEDLPLQQSAGVVEILSSGQLVKIHQNEQVGSPEHLRHWKKDDEITGFKKSWVKAAIVVNLKFKNGFPTKGFHEIEVIAD